MVHRYRFYTNSLLQAVKNRRNLHATATTVVSHGHCNAMVTPSVRTTVMRPANVVRASTYMVYSVRSILEHYSDVIMGAMAPQITSLPIVYSIVYSGADQRKHQSSASLAFVKGIHRWPVNSPHKGPVTRKMFLFDDVIMEDDYFQWLGFVLLWYLEPYLFSRCV